LDWNQLKNEIYVWDGGWLDIYVHNTNKNDWETWSKYINQNFRIEWYNGKTEKVESKIDFSVIKEFWEGNHDLSSTSRIFIDNIQINAHFFDSDEIENDIDPREFKDIEDHNKLVKYLIDISSILKKEVTVTPENCPEIILIKVNKDIVEITKGLNPREWPVRTKK